MIRRGTIAVLGLALLAASCARETQVRTPTGPTAGTQSVVSAPGGIIPAGATVWLTLTEPIGQDNQVGDRFTARVAQNVSSDRGELLIPAGATVTGRIVELEESGRTGEEAVIGLAFDSIQIGGTTQSFSANVVETTVPGGGRRPGIGKKEVLGGAAIGAIIGGVTKGLKGAVVGGALGAGAGTLISLGRGDVPAELPAGTQLAAQTTSPVRSLAAIRGHRGVY